MSSFGFRNRPYTRLPLINNADRSISADPPADPIKFCRRCSLILDYMEDRDLYYCRKCGDGIPDDLLQAAKNKQTQEQQEQRRKEQQQPILTGTRNPSSSPSTSQETATTIPIASKGRRVVKKRGDEFDYLKKDDAVYSEKLGWTVVSDHIDIVDDHKTISSEELKQEKAKLRGKTIR